MLAEAVAAISLAYMGLEDIRRREVSERIYIALLAATIAAKLVDHLLLGEPLVRGPLPAGFYIASDLVMLVSAAALAALGVYGWGDVAALLLATAASPGAPPRGVTPTIVLAMMYSAGILLAYAFTNMAVNLARHRRELARVPPRLRLLYMIAARPVPARELAERPGWRYPLSLCGKYRVRFNIYLDPPDIAREVRRAIEKGCVKPDDPVWVARGHPGIALIAAGYAASILLPDPLYQVARAAQSTGG